MSAKKLDLLWTRLEDAKLRLDLAHNHVKETRQHYLSSPDGNYAHRHSVHAEELAVKNYRRALSDFVAARPAWVAEPSTDSLTAREREVLALVASGKSSKEIGESLGIAFKTVVCHRYRAQTKLKAHNTADMTRAALRMGLIEL